MEAGDLFVDGTVVDAGTGQPLANAQVQIFVLNPVPGHPGLPDSMTSSDKDGSFHIPLKSSSTYSLTVTSDGYICPGAPGTRRGVRPAQSRSVFTQNPSSAAAW